MISTGNCLHIMVYTSHHMSQVEDNACPNKNTSEESAIQWSQQIELFERMQSAHLEY